MRLGAGTDRESGEGSGIYLTDELKRHSFEVLRSLVSPLYISLSTVNWQKHFLYDFGTIENSIQDTRQTKYFPRFRMYCPVIPTGSLVYTIARGSLSDSSISSSTLGTGASHTWVQILGSWIGASVVRDPIVNGATDTIDAREQSIILCV